MSDPCMGTSHLPGRIIENMTVTAHADKIHLHYCHDNKTLNLVKPIHDLRNIKLGTYVTSTDVTEEATVSAQTAEGGGIGDGATGAIIGGVVGAIVLTAVAIFAVIYCRRRMAQPPKAVLGVGVPVEMMGDVKGSSAVTSTEEKV